MQKGIAGRLPAVDIFRRRFFRLRGPRTVNLKSLINALLLTIAVYSSLRAKGQNWTLTSAPNTNWVAVACSADGTKLVAAVNGGGIYTSSDAGVSWLLSSAPITNWASIAASESGLKLVAAAGGERGPGTGPIYISTNAGTNWSLTTAPFSSWNSVASSANGNVLVACQYAPAPLAFGLIYTSTNSGVTWEPGNTDYCWFSAAASADGSTLAVVGTVNVYQHGNFSQICVSTNAGAGWTNFTAPAAGWTCIACSSDGKRLVSGNFQPGTISISTNGGVVWNDTSAPTQNWSSVASSADGTRLVAAANGFLSSPAGPIYTSADSGASWTSNSAPFANWSSVASSADGKMLTATVYGGGIYTWHAPTVVPGTVLWTYDGGGCYGIFAPPAVAQDGTVYLMTGAGLTALTNSGGTGSNKWSRPFGGSPSIGADGTIYLANGSSLFAVNPDGSQKWSYPVQGGGAPVQGGGTPAIGSDGTIYFEGYFALYAINPAGTLKWQSEIAGTGQYSSPVIGPDGTVYAGSFEGVNLFAINPDGSRKWVYNFASAPFDAPALGIGGTIFISAGFLNALTPDGTLIWSPEQNLGGPPVTGLAERLYVSSLSRGLLAIDTARRVTSWTYVVDGTPRYGQVTAPAVDAAGIVYFCVSNTVWALTPEGSVQWNLTTDLQPKAGIDLANSSPIIDDKGTLYAAIGSKLYAIATGTNGPANSSWPMYQQNARHTGKIERPFLALPQSGTGSNFKFQLYPNQLGLTYSIETSTNLTTWTTLTNVFATALPTEVTDISASNASTRFYRASVGQ